MLELFVLIGTSILRLVELALLLALVYHYLFVVASVRELSRYGAGRQERRFAVVIPAHDEEAVIATTVHHTYELDYPSDQYDIHVIADHCSDGTAELAAGAGATAHVRSEQPAGRKGYALAWALPRLFRVTPPYDAFVVLDADSRIDGRFLRVMDAVLDSGDGVLQGQRIVNNPKDSMLARISELDQRLNNRLRNQARTNLGWSCRLMGDAMCFARRVVEANPWASDSLVEDREYGAGLLLKGIRTRYVPQAVVYQQAAITWQSGRQQRLRWYRGAVEVQRRLAVKLIKAGLKNHSMAQLDGGIELLMPAYSILLLCTMLTLVIDYLAFSDHASVFTVLMAVATLGWIAYPILGLLSDRAPARTFRALLYGPVYIIWRGWLAILTKVLGNRIRWVRTERREEIHKHDVHTGPDGD